MPSLSESALPLALVALAVAVVVQTARLAWQRALPSRRIAASRERGAAAERRAAPVLEARGYTIVGSQVRAKYTIVVDDEEVPVDLRADYLVERDGRTFVAEVKAGALAPRIGTIATRRQLLEYGVAFDVDGVLLVDAERGRVHRVGLPRGGERPPAGGGALSFLVGALSGALVVWAYLR